MAGIYKPGRPFTYNPKLHDKLVESVEAAKGSLGQVADLNKIPRQTFRDWVRLGDEQNAEGQETDFVQLSCSIRKRQAEVIMDMVRDALDNTKKAIFTMWWLGRVCREDFGQDSQELKELRELFEKILPMMGKGAKGNAKELDSGSDKEQGETSSGARGCRG
jgi:hypothetical protein